MRRKLRRRFQVRWAAWADSWLRLEERRSQKSSQVDGFWRGGCWVVSWILHLARETLLGGQLQKKKSRCCGKRQFVETESFCLNACFSKFLSYTNKCPGQVPDGSSGRWSGLDGAYHPVSWPGAGMRHDLRFTAHLGASLWLGHWRPWETARSCRQQAPEILGKVQKKKKIIKFWSGVMIFYLFF